jgi:hypothetical protein
MPASLWLSFMAARRRRLAAGTFSLVGPKLGSHVHLAERLATELELLPATGAYKKETTFEVKSVILEMSGVYLLTRLSAHFPWNRPIDEQGRLIGACRARRRRREGLRRVGADNVAVVFAADKPSITEEEANENGFKKDKDRREAEKRAELAGARLIS